MQHAPAPSPSPLQQQFQGFPTQQSSVQNQPTMSKPPAKQPPQQQPPQQQQQQQQQQQNANQFAVRGMGDWRQATGVASVKTPENNTVDGVQLFPPSPIPMNNQVPVQTQDPISDSEGSSTNPQSGNFATYVYKNVKGGLASMVGGRTPPSASSQEPPSKVQFASDSPFGSDNE